MKMDLKKLDSDVISKIRSSFNISSVAQCVFELVADNGEGITRENMELLGVRYATNKCRRLEDLEKNLKTYGFRGEAIASIVEMCKSVNVNSRFKTSSETYSKVLSKEFKCKVKLVKRRASAGTTVTVLGWLSNVPVRRQRIVQELELEEVKKRLESLVIINPRTSFTLRNDVTGLLLLNCPKNADIVGSFRHLHPDISSDSFALLKVSKNKVSVEMLAQKELILTKKFQYVYVNKRPVKSSRILRHIYKSFYRKHHGKTKNSVLYNTKRYPVYIVNIKCPQSCVDSLLVGTEVEFTCWDIVLACIDKLLKTFLGLEEDKEKMSSPKKMEDKFNCGISQLFGTVQASAFKRKSSEAGTDEDGDSEVVNISKIRRLEDDVEEIGHRHSKAFVRDMTTLSPSQKSGNYRIEDSGEHQQFVKPFKIKSIIKKPLGINVKPNTGSGEENNNGVALEVFGKKYWEQQNQFDQRSVYSRLNADEVQGKDLIMDMFLKSTQVFKDEAEDVFEQSYEDASKETIEESNFLFENDVRDAVKGINTTMSISVNVKKRRLKNSHGRVSKCVQTSVLEDKLTSKCVQTSQRPEVVHQKASWNDFDIPVPVSDKITEKMEINGKPNSQRFCTDENPGIAHPNQACVETNQNPCLIRQRGIATGSDNSYMIRYRNDSNPKYKQCFHKDADSASVLWRNRIQNRMSTKCTQTSQNPRWLRQESYQTDLANRFDGFTLGRENTEDLKDDYTILINTVRKKREYTFVRKSDGMEESEEDTVGFVPLKVCYCGNEDEKMFKFSQGEAIELPSLEGKIDAQLSSSPTLFRKRGRETISEFKKPTIPLAKPKTWRKTANVRNRDERPLCSKSPYFSKTNNIQFSGCNFPIGDNLNSVVASPFFATIHSENKLNDTLQECQLPKAKMSCHNVSNCKKFFPPERQVRCCSLTKEHYNPYKLAENCGIMDITTTNNHYQCTKEDVGGNHRCLNLNTAKCPHGAQKIVSAEEAHNFAHPFKEFPKRKLCWNPASYNERGCRLQIRDTCLGSNLHQNLNSTDTTPLQRKFCNDQQDCNVGVALLESEVYKNATEPSPKPCFPQGNISAKNEHCHQFTKNLVLFQNQPLEPGSDDRNWQAMDTSNSPWYTPIVSDENRYFEPSAIEDADARDEKLFDFKLSCSPNIFSEEVLKGEDVKANEQVDKMDLDDLNTLCDLADFHLVGPDQVPLTTEASKLVISLPSNEERKRIVEKELLEFQVDKGRNSFSYEKEVQIKEPEPKIADVNISEPLDDRSRIIVDSQNEWLRQINDNGRVFFVNTRTGMVAAKTPKLSRTQFEFDERLDFVPKGMSPVLKGHKKIDVTLGQDAKSKLHDLILEGYNDELMVIKWRNFTEDDPKAFFEKIYREKSKQFESCAPSIRDNDLKMPKDFVSFSNKMFRSIDIVGQVDRKFIAVRERTKDLLILFDQHAVHERIRVERFLKEYKGTKTPCKVNLTIFMPHNDLGLLKRHCAYVESLGLGVEFFTNGLHVTHIPLCVQEKFHSEANCEEIHKVCNMLVKDTLEFLTYTRGSTTKLAPKIIQNIINLKACRGAVKFGDALTRQECINLLRDLSKCKLPFQCAHGRPTLTPILTLSKAVPKVTMKKLDLKKLLLTKSA